MSNIAHTPSPSGIQYACSIHVMNRVQKQFEKILQGVPSVIGIEFHLIPKEQIFVALIMLMYRNFGNVLLIWRGGTAYVFPHITDDCIDIFKQHGTKKLEKKTVDSGLLSEETVTLFRHRSRFEIFILTDFIGININELLWSMFSKFSDRTVFVSYDIATNALKGTCATQSYKEVEGTKVGADMDYSDLEDDGCQSESSIPAVANVSTTSWPGAESRSENIVVSPVIQREYDNSPVQNTGDTPDGHASCLHEVSNGLAANSGPTTSSSYRNSCESQPDCRTQFRPSLQPKHEHYQEENTRRASFVHWPASKRQEPALLARMGFYLSGPHDTVVCFYCGVRIRSWESEDDPAVEHVRNSPDCYFIARQLGQYGLCRIQELITGNKADDAMVENTACTSSAIATRQGASDRRNTPARPTFYPRNPRFDTKEKRLQSFGNKWTFPERTESLAEAGLYYSGVADIVRCFACDGGLRQWDSVDNPWVEHARWFPECPFVLQEKGQEFVQEVASLVRDNENRAQRKGNTMNSQNDTYAEEEFAELTLEESNDTSDVLENINIEQLNEMGFATEDIARTVRNLKLQKSPPFTTEDIVEALLVSGTNDQGTTVQARAQVTGRTQSKPDAKVLRGENQKLQDMLTCSVCKKKERNILFLPCSHHKMCMGCAAHVNQCNECGRYIQQKVRTYMG